MTVTTYYAAHELGQPHAEADALIHLVNDMTSGNGDNRSWDAVRAQLNAVSDPDTQARLKIVIGEESSELVSEE